MGHSCCARTPPARAGRIAALLPMLACAFCPVCLGLYAGALSAVGLGFLLSERVHAALVGLSVAVALGSLLWSARRHRWTGPLGVGALGAGVALAGDLAWDSHPLLLTGVALLMLASLWDVRRRRARGLGLVP